MNSQFAWTFLRADTRQTSDMPGKARIRRYVGLGVLLLILLPAGMAGASWLHERLTHVEENDARVAGEVTTVASRLDGWLITRPVMEGDRVSKGQVLAELDNSRRQAALGRNRRQSGGPSESDPRSYPSARHDTANE
jgi:membrane fusion protein (multidrug efflux system)